MCTHGKVGTMSSLDLYPKGVDGDIVQATGDRKGLRITVKLTIQNRLAYIKVMLSPFFLIIKVLKEPPRDRSKEKK